MRMVTLRMVTIRKGTKNSMLLTISIRAMIHHRKAISNHPQMAILTRHKTKVNIIRMAATILLKTMIILDQPM